MSLERGRAPDDRDIEDIMAIDRCPHCEAKPAAAIITEGHAECYHCGGDL